MKVYAEQRTENGADPAGLSSSELNLTTISMDDAGNTISQKKEESFLLSKRFFF